MSGIAEDTLHALLSEAFPGADIALEDLTGTRDHWKARIVTAAFEGASLVKRHRQVYRALREQLQGPVHALALETLTPAEAEAEAEA